MITVPFVFMVLRFYCKMSTRRHFGWDDAVLLLSWVGGILPLAPPPTVIAQWDGWVSLNCSCY